MPDDDMLNSWKEIAAHFKRHERTVRRWRDQNGLPVHRPVGGQGSVYASKAELDIWWKRNRAKLAPSHLAAEPVSQIAASEASSDEEVIDNRSAGKGKKYLQFGILIALTIAAGLLVARYVL